MSDSSQPPAKPLLVNLANFSAIWTRVTLASAPQNLFMTIVKRLWQLEAGYDHCGGPVLH